MEIKASNKIIEDKDNKYKSGFSYIIECKVKLGAQDVNIGNTNLSLTILISHPNNFGIYLKNKNSMEATKNHIFAYPQGSTLLSY